MRTPYVHRAGTYARGSVLLIALVLGGLAASIAMASVASYALFEHKASLTVSDRSDALHIAEAGIEYYRWYLAHNPGDYQDGTGVEGPYVHAYENKDSEVVGTFSLEIDPPLSGSSVVTIRSTGWMNHRPSERRTIQVRIGFPSFTEYTFLTNANMNFGFTSVVSGMIHSNGGIRFDGTTDSWVRSAKDRYQYENQTHHGVWGGGGPKSFWQYPVAPVDFQSVTTDMAAIKTSAQAGGVYLSSSGAEGWHVVFTTSTYKLYKVTSRDCYYGEGRWRRQRGDWVWDGTTYCYDIKNETLIGTYGLPGNGMMFAEDDVWVEGVVDGRVTLAVGKFPVQEPYKKIYVVNNLRYATESGDDVIGLMAQGDIVVPYEVPEVMRIDAGLLSQNGFIYRPFYDSDERDQLTVFGSQISYLGGGWKYVNGWGNVISGFVDTIHTYDANLRYYPPPGFPMGVQYEIISWEEVASE
jgi:hypothetical protein